MRGNIVSYIKIIYQGGKNRVNCKNILIIIFNDFGRNSIHVSYFIGYIIVYFHPKERDGYRRNERKMEELKIRRAMTRRALIKLAIRR